MYYGDYGNYGNVGKPIPFDGFTRVKTDKLKDALPISSYTAPILKLSNNNNNTSITGLSPRGSALAEIGAFAAKLPPQSPETTRNVTEQMNYYLNAYPYV